jgi:hypothetical protein
MKRKRRTSSVAGGFTAAEKDLFWVDDTAMSSPIGLSRRMRAHAKWWREIVGEARVGKKIADAATVVGF